MTFNDLFKNKKPLIGCIHLLALPGAPGYQGSMKKVIETAVREAEIFYKYGIDGLIIENFRDHPFYPDALPPSTIAAMTAVTCEVVKVFSGPVGVNALRNDAKSALSISAASEAQFIRVNVHIGAAVTDQGIIEGKAHETLRLRKNLDERILILADVAVKHASYLGNRTISDETNDLSTRGMADAIIVTGAHTGGEANAGELALIKKCTNLPVLLGSGITLENIEKFYNLADGFIVGSYFKKNGTANNLVEENRVKKFLEIYRLLR